MVRGVRLVGPEQLAENVLEQPGSTHEATQARTSKLEFT